MIVFLYGTIKYIIMIIISRHLLWLYVNRTIYIYTHQDLGIVLMCCFLGSLFKILSCGFVFIGWKCIF